MTAGIISDGWAWARERWQRFLAWAEGVPWARWLAQRAHHTELKAAAAQTVALAAIPEPTDEQRIGLMQQEQGYLLQVANLKRLEEENGKLTREQLGQMQTLQRTLAQLRAARDGASLETVGNQPLSLFGPVGGALGAVTGGWQLWAAAGVGVVALFGAYKLQVDGLQHRIDVVTRARDAACTSRELTGETTRQACVSLAQKEMEANAYRQALEDAKDNVVATAATLRRLEQQRQAAAAAQRRNQHDVESVLSGIGDPPDFGLRTRANSQGNAPAAPAAPADRSR